MSSLFQDATTSVVAIDISTTHLSDHLKWSLVQQKVGNYVRVVITHNVIWANQKTKTFLYRWLCSHAMFDVMCLPAFVGASRIISRVLSICLNSDLVTVRVPTDEGCRCYPWTDNGCYGVVKVTTLLYQVIAIAGGQHYQGIVSKCYELMNGQFYNCQSWSFITVHGNF